MARSTRPTATTLLSTTATAKTQQQSARAASTEWPPTANRSCRNRQALGLDEERGREQGPRPRRGEGVRDGDPEEVLGRPHEQQGQSVQIPGEQASHGAGKVL